MKNKTFADILKRLNEIKKIANLTDQEIKLLSQPKKVNHATLQVGHQKLSAWRILFNDALGPGKGGVQIKIRNRALNNYQKQ